MRRRRRTHAADRVTDHAPAHDRWLISYADFVTLLLAVFIVLFAFSRANKQDIRTMSTSVRSGFQDLSLRPQQKGVEVAPPVVTQQPDPAQLAGPPPFDTAELKKQLEGVLGDSINKREIVMQQTPEGLIISLRELGFFNSGEATLLPGAADKLRGTAQVLMQRGLEVRVEGHSDDQPIHSQFFKSNWELSTARASSVLSLLLDDAGFPPTKISIAGYGPYRPVADNATPDGRRMNRRVDLVVIAPKSKEEVLH